MNKLKLQNLPKVSLITFIIGLVIVINSAGWGIEAANAYLRAHGGGMDTVQFSAILQGSINSFCTIGAVLFFLGGLGCLISIIFLEMQKQ
ncbi:MAG: hypothetical protein O8C66_02215 [Candidatus Methanoperedens sp.]|nr:hypothetical protein [Candidatus Methanoperedens sp.]MCZ7369301.1 hypothetical protein [Candidatus Methanoperedens sp.]